MFMDLEDMNLMVSFFGFLVESLGTLAEFMISCDQERMPFEFITMLPKGGR